jgi:hypothetical protein
MSRVSQITWRTSVADHPTEDTPATVLRCRINPYLDQAAPLRGAGPGVSAAALPWEARAAHAGPREAGTHYRNGSTGHRGPGARGAVSLARHRPAHDHRVNAVVAIARYRGWRWCTSPFAD